LDREELKILSRRKALLFALLFAAQIFFVELGLFMYWADPKASQIGGVQGRYFLPLLPCLLIGCSQFATPITQFSFSEQRRFCIRAIPAVSFLSIACLYLLRYEWG
jgi:uncharacterized membrane protein